MTQIRVVLSYFIYCILRPCFFADKERLVYHLHMIEFFIFFCRRTSSARVRVSIVRDFEFDILLELEILFHLHYLKVGLQRPPSMRLLLLLLPLHLFLRLVIILLLLILLFLLLLSPSSFPSFYNDKCGVMNIMVGEGDPFCLY